VPILTLARYTIRGYVKERVLFVVLFFAVLLMLSTYLLSPLAVGAREKIVVDIGLASISIMGVLLIVLLGAGSFHQEKERGILKALLVKPITRTDFVLGKYAGTVVTVSTVVLLMALVHFAMMAMSGTPITARVLTAVYLAVLETMVVTAVLTFYSSFTSPVLASFFTLATVAAGHLSKDLLIFADRAKGIAHHVAVGAYYVLPNLGLLNIRSEAVHNLPLADGFVYSVTVYALFYATTLLVLSTLIFRAREVHG